MGRRGIPLNVPWELFTRVHCTHHIIHVVWATFKLYFMTSGEEVGRRGWEQNFRKLSQGEKNVCIRPCNFRGVIQLSIGHNTPETVGYIGVMHMSRCAGPEIAFPFVFYYLCSFFFIILLFWEHRVVREQRIGACGKKLYIFIFGNEGKYI